MEQLAVPDGHVHKQRRWSAGAGPGAAPGAAVGSYDIAPSAALGTGLTNYTISYASGTLTVRPATLLVAADPETKVAGAGDPPLTFVANGFQAGDTAGVLTGALTRAAGETAGSYPISQGTLSANANYAIAFTGNTFVITAPAPPPPPPPPPPPAAISIAPIAPQTNTDGDEVELQVKVIRATTAASAPDAPSRRDVDNDDRMRGTFAISGLNGLKIDNGEISGHIKANVTAITVFNVTVTYTLNGVTATQHITWTVKPASLRRDAKGDRS